MTLGLRFLKRDLATEFGESYLGYFWAFAPPVLTALTLSLARKAAVFDVQSTPVPYAAYVIVSMLFFQIFQQTAQGMIDGFIQAKTLLKQVRYPVAALIVSKAGYGLFSTLIRLLLIIPVFLYFKIELTSFAFLAPLGLLALLFSGLVVGLVVGPLALISQDILQGTSVVLRMLIFATPVVYPMPKGTLFEKILLFNPASAPITFSVEALLVGRPDYLWQTGLIAFVSAIGVAFCVALLSALMPLITERLS
jgi:lipopolysaccharide transport system permease protein